MANRPVFEALSRYPYVMEHLVDFTYFSGYAVSQKQRSIASLHESFSRDYVDCNLLEISSKSQLDLGVALSAFNLKLTINKGTFPVENVFQSSKVFKEGGPFPELLTLSPRDAKRDPRLQSSGTLKGFQCEDIFFPLIPKHLFYNWIYVKALSQNPDLSKALLEFDAFSDIEFNPKRSLNCQARAAALYVGLSRAGRLEEALESPEAFLQIAFKNAKKL